MKRKGSAPQQCAPGYLAMPWAVADSPAYQTLKPQSKALLFEVARQHDGWNNGHMQLTASWLAKRNWKSRRVIFKARDELIAHGLLVCTRVGGRNSGPSLYAVTWHVISDFAGLEIAPAAYVPNGWARFEPLQTAKSAAPKGRAMGGKNPITVPTLGTEIAGAVPTVGLKGRKAVPTVGLKTEPSSTHSGSVCKGSMYKTHPEAGAATAQTAAGALSACRTGA
jgi:hypothetical protein